MMCVIFGMFVNFSVVMFRLCELFLDVNFIKRGKIDFKYVFYSNCFDLR